MFLNNSTIIGNWMIVCVAFVGKTAQERKKSGWKWWNVITIKSKECHNNANHSSRKSSAIISTLNLLRDAVQHTPSLLLDSIEKEERRKNRRRNPTHYSSTWEICVIFFFYQKLICWETFKQSAKQLNRMEFPEAATNECSMEKWLVRALKFVIKKPAANRSNFNWKMIDRNARRHSSQPSTIALASHWSAAIATIWWDINIALPNSKVNRKSSDLQRQGISTLPLVRSIYKIPSEPQTTTKMRSRNKKTQNYIQNSLIFVFVFISTETKRKRWNEKKNI